MPPKKPLTIKPDHPLYTLKNAISAPLTKTQPRTLTVKAPIDPQPTIADLRVQLRQALAIPCSFRALKPSLALISPPSQTNIEVVGTIITAHTNEDKKVVKQFNASKRSVTRKISDQKKRGSVTMPSKATRESLPSSTEIADSAVSGRPPKRAAALQAMHSIRKSTRFKSTSAASLSGHKDRMIAKLPCLQLSMITFCNCLLLQWCADGMSLDHMPLRPTPEVILKSDPAKRRPLPLRMDDLSKN